MVLYILRDEPLIMIEIEYVLYLRKKKDVPTSEMRHHTHKRNLWVTEKIVEV